MDAVDHIKKLQDELAFERWRTRRLTLIACLFATTSLALGIALKVLHG